MAYKFDESQEIILFKLYEFFRESESVINLDRGEIEQLAPVGVSPLFAKKAVDGLESDHLIENEGKFPGDEVYAISAGGISYVEKQLEDESSFISDFFTNHPVKVAGKDISEEQDEIDEWTPLPIDRASKSFQEALDDLDQAIDAISGNNGYAETEPDERDHVVESLRQGRKLMADLCPSMNQIRATLIQPLKHLARKFADSILGEVAKSAAVKIAAWLASLM